LLRFAHKILKNRLAGDFYPANSERMPNNRGFYGFFQRKNRKNLQVQQAPMSFRYTQTFGLMLRKPLFRLAKSRLQPGTSCEVKKL
jgi:hypothetical protein